MKRLAPKSTAAFTLIEILLVIIIIISLMAVLIPNIKRAMNDSKVGTAKFYVTRLDNDLVLLQGKAHGYTPTTEQGLRALVEKPTSEPIPRGWTSFEDKLEVDPWGREYRYEFPGRHNPKSFDVYSVGPDGQPGTDDDIGNWEDK